MRWFAEIVNGEAQKVTITGGSAARLFARVSKTNTKVIFRLSAASTDATTRATTINFRARLNEPLPAPVFAYNHSAFDDIRFFLQARWQLAPDQQQADLGATGVTRRLDVSSGKSVEVT